MKSIKKFLPLIIILGMVLIAFLFYSKGLGGEFSIKGQDGNYSIQNFMNLSIKHEFGMRWNNTLGLGIARNTPTSIITLTMFLFPPEIALSMGYFLAMTLTLIFSFLLFRKWGLDLIPALFGSIAFGLSPHFISLVYGGHMTIVEMPATVSILFYFLTVAFDKETGVWKRWLSVIPAGVAWGVMFSQEPQRGLYLSVMAGLYLLYLMVKDSGFSFKEFGKSLKNKDFYLSKLKALVLLAFLVLTFYHSMQGWLNFAQAGKRYNTQEQVQMSEQQKWEFSSSWSYAPGEILENLAWGYFGKETGNPQTPYWGKFEYFASSEVLGFFVLFFMVLGVALNIKLKEYTIGGTKFSLPHIEQPLVRLFFWIGMFAWLLSMGKYLPGRPFFWLYFKIPFMDRFRIAVKFMAVASFAWVAVAAFGVQSLQDLVTKGDEKTLDKLWKACLIVLGAGAVWFLALLAGRAGITDSLMARLNNRAAADTAAGNMLTSVGRFILLSSIMSGVVALMKYRDKVKLPQKAPLWVLIPAVLIELWSINAFYVKKSYFEPASYYAGDQVIESLKQVPKPFRSAIGLFMPGQGNVGMIPLTAQVHDYQSFQFPFHGLELLGIPSTSRPDVDINRYFSTVLMSSLGGTSIQSADQLIDMNLRLMQLTGVRYLITDGALYSGGQPYPVYNTLVSNQHFIARGMGKAKSGRDHAIFEIPDALPRIALFHNWVSIPGEQGLLRVAQSDFDYEKTVVLDTQSVEGVGTVQKYSEVKIDSYEPWSVKVTTVSDQEGYVLNNMRYDEEWKAYVDGKAIPLIRANGIMQAVKIPAGTHTVEFRFEPDQKWAVLSKYMVWLGAVAGLLIVIMGSVSWFTKNGEAA